jgi:hypothetical protein
MTNEHDPARAPLDLLPLLQSPFPVSPIDDREHGPGVQVSIGAGTMQIFPSRRLARGRRASDAAIVTGLTQVRVEEQTLNAYGEGTEHRSLLRMDRTSILFISSTKGEAL